MTFGMSVKCYEILGWKSISSVLTALPECPVLVVWMVFRVQCFVFVQEEMTAC